MAEKHRKGSLFDFGRKQSAATSAGATSSTAGAASSKSGVDWSTTILAGYLLKKGGNAKAEDNKVSRIFAGKRRNWKQRWFELDVHALNYFDNKEDSEPISSVSLEQGFEVEKDDEKAFRFIVHGGDRSLALQALSAEEYESWMTALNKLRTTLNPRGVSSSITSTKSLDSLAIPLDEVPIATMSVGAVLSSYVPNMILKHCVERVKGQAWVPLSHDFDGAIVFCDISGFTALTERLASEGPYGAEKLVAFLNDYFGKLVRLVVDFGGDVMIFAGDALLAVWKGKLSEATWQATMCAWEMMEKMNNAADPTQPRLHMGIGAGKLSVLQVGGNQDQWIYLTCGEPLSQISPCVGAASPHHTVLSPQAWEIVKNKFKGESIEEGMVRLTGVIEPFAAEPKSDVDRTHYDMLVTGSLRMFIPRVIQRNSSSGQNFVAEMRRVTVMFINIVGLDTTSAACLDRVHQVVATLQNCIYKYGGVINKILLDDKGFVIVAGFGLPPLAHQNDEERGVLAAIMVRKELSRISVQCAIGLTTGRAFCGIVGSEIRREYTMIGDMVNTSARLMTSSTDSITCDRPTMVAALKMNHRLCFDQLESKKFKGKAAAMEIFRPQSRRILAKELRSVDDMREANLVPIVGRLTEILSFARHLDVLLKNRHIGRLILVEGEAGIGKSRLLEEMKMHAIASGATVCSGVADAMEKSTPFFPWRAVFMSLLEMKRDDDHRESVVRIRREERKRLLLAKSAELGVSGTYLPLLNSVCCTNIPETEQTLGLRDKQRIDKTTEVLVSVLKAIAQINPTVILLDDLHSFDSSSRNLAVSVAKLVPNLLLVFSFRTQAYIMNWQQQLLEVPSVQQMKLAGLTDGVTVKLSCLRLGASHMQQAVAKLISEKCGGNPYFAEALVDSLREREMVTVTEEGLATVELEQNLRDVPLPEGLEELLTSRFDQLTASQFLTLKIASALGFEFDADILYEIFPQHGAAQETALAAQIDSDIGTLIAYDFLQPSAPVASKPNRNFDLLEWPTTEGYPMDICTTTSKILKFSNSVTHDAAYSLMLHGQKTELHAAIAQWYELFFSSQLDYISLLLAFHWRSANCVAKAVHYYDTAAERALNLERHIEAVRYLEWPLETVSGSKLTETIPALAKVRLERRMGEAMLGLGEQRSAALHFDTALEYLNKPPPLPDCTLPAVLVGVLLAESELEEAMSEDERIVLKNPSGPFTVFVRRNVHKNVLTSYEMMQLRGVGVKSSGPAAVGGKSGSGDSLQWKEACVQGMQSFGVVSGLHAYGPPSSHMPSPTSAQSHHMSPPPPVSKQQSFAGDSLISASLGQGPRRSSEFNVSEPQQFKDRHLLLSGSTGAGAGGGAVSTKKIPLLSPSHGWIEQSALAGISTTSAVESTRIFFLESDCNWFSEHFAGRNHLSVAGKLRDVCVLISLIIDRQPSEAESAVIYIDRRKESVVNKRLDYRTYKSIVKTALDGRRSAREVAHTVAPDLAQFTSMQWTIVRGDWVFDNQMIKFERELVSNKYSAAVMLMPPAGDPPRTAPPSSFSHFLSLLGDRASLRQFPFFHGDLDTSDDATGTESVFSRFGNMQLMFYVSTLVPAEKWKPLVDKVNVMIVFVEAESAIVPEVIRGAETQIVIVVQPSKGAVTIDGVPVSAGFDVAIARRDAIFPVSVVVPEQPLAPRDLQSWILTAVINSERAVLLSPTSSECECSKREKKLLEIVQKFFTST